MRAHKQEVLARFPTARLVRELEGGPAREVFRIETDHGAVTAHWFHTPGVAWKAAAMYTILQVPNEFSTVEYAAMEQGGFVYR